MSIRTFVAAGAALLLAAPSVAAQDPGAVEIGVHALFTGSDPQTGVDDGVGVGGSLGVFLNSRFSAEAALGYAWTEDLTPVTGSGSYLPIRGRVLINFKPLEAVRPFIGVGVVRNSYSGVVDGSDFGVGPIAGLRLMLNERLALRSDVSFDHVWSPFNEGQMDGEDVIESHSNWAITTGLSYLVGGSPRDSDGDGVPDRGDECMGTPFEFIDCFDDPNLNFVLSSYVFSPAAMYSPDVMS